MPWISRPSAIDALFLAIQPHDWRLFTSAELLSTSLPQSHLNRQSHASDKDFPMRSKTKSFPNLWPVKSMVFGILITLGGCTTTASTKPVAFACSAFRPITWSSTDDTRTIAEVKSHNAAGKELCGWKR